MIKRLYHGLYKTAGGTSEVLLSKVPSTHCFTLYTYPFLIYKLSSKAFPHENVKNYCVVATKTMFGDPNLGFTAKTSLAQNKFAHGGLSNQHLF